MIAAWMVYAALWTLWLSLVASVIERVLLRARVPVRGVWTVALLVSVASPFIASLARRRAEIPIAPRPVRVEPSVPREALVLVDAPAPPRSASDRDHIVRVAMVADGWLLAGWIGLSVLALAYVVGGFVHLRYLRRRWRPRVVNGTPLMVSDDVGPAVIGVVRSTIVVPEWSLALEPEAVTLMLRHELEHQRAGDVRLLAVARFAAIAMPWNVALWWQLRRLRFAVEMDCDARVLWSISDVHLYGRLLIECGKPRRARAFAGTPLVGHGTQLERRIRRMTQAPIRGRKAIVSGCIVAAAVALLVACQLPAPQSSPPPASPAAPMVSTRPKTVGDSLRVVHTDSLSADQQRALRRLADSTLGPTVARDSNPMSGALNMDVRKLNALSIEMDSLSALMVSLRQTRTDEHPALRPLLVKLDSLSRRSDSLLSLTKIRSGSYRSDPVSEQADSLRRVLSRLEQVYAQDHPLIRQLTQLIDSRAFTSNRVVAAGGVGCATGAVPDNVSVVKLLIPDSGATARGGRVFFRSEVTTGTGVRVEYGRRETNLDFARPALSCESSEPAEIHLWLPGPFDVAPIVVRTARKGWLVVTTTSGDTRAGPVAVDNAARSYELAWVRR